MLPMDDVISEIHRLICRTVNGPAPDANIFFMHIPKCGGGSIHEAIRDRYKGQKPVYWLSSRASTRAARLAGMDEADIRRCLLLYQMSNQPAGYISGHYPFSSAAWNEYGDRWLFVTVLRDPVKRWFSHFFYNRYKTHSDYYRVEQNLQDFVYTDRAAAWGFEYVRFLSERCDKLQAVDHLARFDLVGLIEDLPSFAAAFENLTEARLNIGHHNESPATQRHREEVTEGIVERVRELCAPDMAVYQRAKELARSTGCV